MINAIRAHLAEFGIVAPVGRKGVEQLLAVVGDARIAENQPLPEGLAGEIIPKGGCQQSSLGGAFRRLAVTHAVAREADILTCMNAKRVSYLATSHHIAGASTARRTIGIHMNQAAPAYSPLTTL
jgi:hypothetical protein